MLVKSNLKFFRTCAGCGAPQEEFEVERAFPQIREASEENQNEEKTSMMTVTQNVISQVCDEIKEMLLSKNRKYGDSAINPIRIFSNASPIEQINVRLDDKLNRMRNQQLDEDEDVDMDFAGYSILKIVAKRIQGEKENESRSGNADDGCGSGACNCG